MSEDYAFKDYNQYSSPQLAVMMRMSNAFHNALNNARILTNSTIFIADYGSSECLNSLLFFKDSFAPFRETSQQPILLFHNDLPTNNWTKSFKTILEHQNSYVNLPNIYFSSIGRSFFNQILPDSSVHIGFSSLAFHFLSEDLCAPDHALASSSVDQEFKERIVKFAHEDLINLLELRYKELVDHGVLLMQFAGENMDIGVYLHEANEKAYEKGIINREEKRNLSTGSYGRTTEEVQRALDIEREKFKVLYISKEKIPMFNEKNEKNIEVFLGLCRGFLGFKLQKSVRRTDEERNQILKFYIDELLDIFERRDHQLLTDIYIISLEKIPKER
ncbi:unnamed protein product [Blepharisma stoltei]|uniref:SAM dependent carboxyl methyltransferase n=1 Tax=Blepharisma stoltei TaxID=1481888 RepID=A0AAU9KDU3_9CILI|nr:unnamed protein product [Blepharisma stoltei]